MDCGPQSTKPAELTVCEAAKLLGVSRHSVYRYIRQGLLPRRHVGLPNSRRATYRLLADEVMDLRNAYERHDCPEPTGRRKATKRITTADLEFIRLR
jgi:excisionase family DNA binding protein